jgi:YesN/AraC family two-component response regulator
MEKLNDFFNSPYNEKEVGDVLNEIIEKSKEKIKSKEKFDDGISIDDMNSELTDLQNLSDNINNFSLTNLSNIQNIINNVWNCWYIW